MLVEWSIAGVTQTRSPLLHQAFADCARRLPEAVAVLGEGVAQQEAVTYGELARRSGVLASRLRGLEVGPESVVGLCLERCPEMITALLAILESGGAYLPLDPKQPAERLSFMLADARAKVLVSEERFLAAFGALPAGLSLLVPDARPAAELARVAPARLHRNNLRRDSLRPDSLRRDSLRPTVSARTMLPT